MRRPLIALATGSLLLAGAGLLTAPAASAQDVPGVSRNVQPVFNVPDPGMVSGAFAKTGDFFYSSGLGDLRVYDTSDPRRPLPLGVVAEAVFENEAMTYAEKTVGGVLKRFIFVGNDLVQASAGGTGGAAPSIGRTGGREIVVFEVTNPLAPVLVRRVPTTTSTHTLQCVTTDCAYAYTAGDDGTATDANPGSFSIVDFRDLGVNDVSLNIKEVKTVASPSAKGPFASGHYWDFDTAGLGWHTGGGGASAFSVADPLNPVLLATTNPDGTSDIAKNETANYNDFILHNSMRPNGERFTPGRAPSVFNGNVLIATEEDYTNDGDEVICSESGSIETWSIPSLAGLPADADTGSGTISPLSELNPVQGVPARAFCSAHWFDHHQDGFLAQGFYQGGLQIVDVRDAAALSSYGFFQTPAATEVWDAYWVPVRDAAGVDTGAKTNVVYTADAVKGLDVFAVNLPGDPVGPDPVVPEVPVAAIVPLVAAVVLGGAVVVRRRQAGLA